MRSRQATDPRASLVAFALRRGAFAFVLIVGSGAFVACSALTSFEGLAATSGDTSVEGGAAEASAGGDAGGRVDASTGAADDAGSGSDSAPQSPWGQLTVMQTVGSTGKTTVSLNTPTTAGTLLVALQAGPVAPSGKGWLGRTSSDGSDSVFIFPNNPGGLQSFTIAGGNNNADVILIEFSGAPSNVGFDSNVDTGAKAATVSSIDIEQSSPIDNGALALLWVDTNGSTKAAAITPGWQALGTDNNNNFGWWQAAQTTTSTSTKVTVNVDPPSPSSLLLVTLVAK